MQTEESREIQHFHYTKWPDFGVPSNPEVFLEFLYAVRHSKVLDADKGPAVVHCSAGIGRSGTFCIVDTLLTKVRSGDSIWGVEFLRFCLSPYLPLPPQITPLPTLYSTHFFMNVHFILCHTPFLPSAPPPLSNLPSYALPTIPQNHTPFSNPLHPLPQISLTRPKISLPSTSSRPSWT